MGVDYRDQYERGQLEAFFPNEIVKMGVVVLCTLAVLMFLVVLPTLLEAVGVVDVFHEEEPANPASTPAHIGPEWYFLATYQYLKLMPQEFLGMNGKALGIFSQGIGVLMLLTAPFWFPLLRADLRTRAWPWGLAAFVGMLATVVGVAAGLGAARAVIEGPTRDLLHPMFVWPPLAAIAFVAAGLAARWLGLERAFEWLRLYSSGLILIGFQFMAFVAVLGQGLSQGMDPTTAYAIGGGLFAAFSIAVLGFVVARARNQDRRWRWKALVVFVTEGLFLFVGMTVWALWPPGGLWEAEKLSHDAKGFLFSALLILIAAMVFFALIATERRAIRRTLGPSHEEER